MPPVHRVGDQRACGATTIDTGLNTKVLVEGQPAAVTGMLDSHSMLGPLISIASGMTGTQVLVQGIPMIVAMVDQSGPDQIGLISHVTNFPTPMTGSNKVQAYGGLGIFGGGLGTILSGNLQVGELVNIGSQLIGQVQNFTNVGGGGGLAILKNLASSAQDTGTISGQVLVGQTSGNTFLMGAWTTTKPDAAPGTIVTDEFGEVVTIDTGETVTL